MESLQKVNEVKKKATEILTRDSILDSYLKVPWNNEPGFKGFFVLLIFLITIGNGLEAFMDYCSKGSFFDPTLMHYIVKDLPCMATCCVYLVLYSFT